MPDRNIILRLQSVVSGSVGRAFGNVNQSVEDLQANFRASGKEVSDLTREMKKLAAEGKDVTDIERRLDDARRATQRWREELTRANARLERIDNARKSLDGIANAFNKINLASGIFSAAVGFGLNELNQRIVEMGEAVNRASLDFEQGTRVILAAQRAGLRDAEGFVEEWKEIPRALNEAYESADKLAALEQLGLNPDELLGQDPTERFLRIAQAVRAVDRDSRQYLLETGGLTGQITDQLLHFANLSDDAFARFVDGARNGVAVTQAQADASQAMNEEIQALKQELLLGGLTIVQQYLPAIKALIGALADGAGAVFAFAEQNRPLIIILASLAVGIAATSAAYKAGAVAIGIYRAAVLSLSKISVVGWSNPLIAALAAIGIALTAAVWLFSLFNKEADQASRTDIPEAPETPGVSQAAIDRQAARFRAQGAAQAQEIDFYAQPRQSPGAAAQPRQSPAAQQVTYNIPITINATVAGAADLAEEIARQLPSALQRALDTGVYARR